MQYFLSHAPNKDASIWHQLLIGAVENISPNETAYFHRKAIIAQEYITSWKCDDEENRNIRWVKGLRESLDPYTLGDYVNWPDIDIKNWQTSYYGSNFHRLRKVKPCMILVMFFISNKVFLLFIHEKGDNIKNHPIYRYLAVCWMIQVDFLYRFKFLLLLINFYLQINCISYHFHAMNVI